MYLQINIVHLNLLVYNKYVNDALNYTLSYIKYVDKLNSKIYIQIIQWKHKSILIG